MSEDYRIVQIRDEPPPVVVEGVEASGAQALARRTPARGRRRQPDGRRRAEFERQRAEKEPDAIAEQIALEPAGERDQVTPSAWFG